MKQQKHLSARSTHYDNDAKFYDILNEENSRITNNTIENILRKHHIKSILDLTCGTGSQVFWLIKHVYDVVGSDINSNMLRVARSKAKKEKLSAKFIKGDMRTIQVGKFDAVITIFNSIGHLTKKDYEKTLRNIRDNLIDGGIYIFDIFNLSYLLKDDNITKLTIDNQETSGTSKVRKTQYSTINKEGILASYTISHSQDGAGKLKISSSTQTLQVYSAKQLKEMLEKNGFRVLGKCSIDGSKFSENKTERIVMIAKKKASKPRNSESTK